MLAGELTQPKADLEDPFIERIRMELTVPFGGTHI